MRMGSVLFAAGVLLASPELAMAQRRPPPPPPPVSVPPPIAPMPGPASLDVPHPIPPISISPGMPRDLYQQLTPSGPRDLFRELTPTQRIPRSLFVPGFGYGSSYYVPGYAQGMEPAPARVAPVARGGLLFETIPGSAQVYVDGYYVGLVADFGISGRALELEAGPHRVELRAAGYATLAFSVNIVANQTTRYRGDLQRIAATVPLPAAPAAPKTTYVIPNCYAGDRPPARPLPAGCDIKMMRSR